MNRGIHLSILEPNEEDLNETALAITKFYAPRLIEDYKEYFKYLASTYFEYKKDLKQNWYKFESKFEKGYKKKILKNFM